MPDREDQLAPRRRQDREGNKGPAMIVRGQMLPDPDEKNQSEVPTFASDELEIGKAIVDPVNSGGEMKFPAGAAQAGDRLDGNDLVTLASEPGGVTPGSGADIEDSARRRRQQVPNRREDRFGGERLKSFGEGRRVSRIASKHGLGRRPVQDLRPSRSSKRALRSRP